MRRLALLLCLALTPITAPVAADTGAAVTAASLGPTLSAALAEINRHRARAGVPALILNPKLSAAARGHAQDMARYNYFSHTSRDGRTFVDRIEAAGYTSFTALAENIARGQRSWSAAISSWMQSPGHRANMLSRDYRELGLGASRGYWVQDFGTRARPTSAPKATTEGEIGAPARFTAP